MYPQVTQFETRDRLVAERLDLVRVGRLAASSVVAKRRLPCFAVRPALFSRSHRASVGIS